MTEQITTEKINPFYLSVMSFKKEGIKDKQEGSVMLEYHKQNIYVLQNTIFYQLLRLIKLPIGEYRKFANHDKGRLLNVYFRTLSSSLIWEVDISKQQDTFRTIGKLGVECSIFQVFSIRKVKEIKSKGKKSTDKSRGNYQDENALLYSLLLVVMAFSLYFFFQILGGS